MEIYFKCDYEPKRVDSLIKKALKLDIAVCINTLYILDINTKKITTAAVPPVHEDYIVTIYDETSLKRFERMVRGEELARFNSGKPKYSYIDFRLFNQMLAESDYNLITASALQYVSHAKNALSKVCFSNGVKQQEALGALQSLIYKASLAVNNITTTGAIISLKAFTSTADVLEYGAKKYARNNWRKLSPEPLAAADSMYRHIDALLQGEELDPESNLPHLGHIMCNVMFLSYHLTRIE